MIKFILRNYGMSLVEVMVAGSLVGGLALAGMRVMENAQKGQKSTEGKSDFMMLRLKIHELVSNKNFCKKAFLDSSGNILKYPTVSDDLTELVMDTGAGKVRIVKVGEKEGTIQIKRLFLRPQKDNSTPPVPIPPIPDSPTTGQTTHFLELIVDAERQGGVKITNMKLPEKITFVTQADETLVSCSVAGGSAVTAMSLVSFRQNGDVLKKAGNVLAVAPGMLVEAGSNNMMPYSSQQFSAFQGGSGVYKIKFDQDMSPMSERFVQITVNNFAQTGNHSGQKTMTFSIPGTDYYWLDSETLVVVIYATVNFDGDRNSRDRVMQIIPTSGNPNPNTVFSVLVN